MLQYEACVLCPRRCGVNRLAGERGFCGMPAELRAARAMLHFGEEPAISGEHGTGAVFFSGCTLRCVFCQNSPISHAGFGAALRPKELRAIFERLINEGAQSIDLVTPTQFLPSIIPALTPKLPVPVVYNCGGYERVETLRELEGLIDVYLPDLKYADDSLAAQLSGAQDYFPTAAAAIREMYRQTGAPVLKDGILQRGVLIRHLILPGFLENTLRVLDWIREAFPKGGVLLSLMSQYIPVGQQKPPLDRVLTGEEYDGALSWLRLCGLQDGYVQELSSATAEYLPDFHLQGLNLQTEQ